MNEWLKELMNGTMDDTSSRNTSFALDRSGSGFRITRAHRTQTEARMEGKKVLNIAIDKVICSNKDGETALPGLESGEAFIRSE